jgi:hypothetical protein
MKRILILLLFSLGSGLLLNSCVNKAKMQQLRQIDSVMVIVRDAEKKIMEVNYDSIHEKYKLYTTFAPKVSENYYELKNDESWPYLCAYRNVRKPLKEMDGNYKDLKLNIDSAKVHLDNLKYDASNGVISAEDFNRYFLNEMLSAKKLFDRIGLMVDNAKKEEANFDTIHPWLVRFINEAEKAKRNFKNKK